MSTYYRLRTQLKLDDVRKMKEFDVVKDGKDWGFQSKESFLSVETNSKGYVMDVYRHGQNDVVDIFPHIKNELGVTFISEEGINYSNYRDEESKVYQLKFEDGSTCYRTKSEDDSGVVTLQYSTEGGANLYDPNDKKKSNGIVIEEIHQFESITLKSTQHLKDTLCHWLDNIVDEHGSDKDASSRIDDDGKLHFKIYDVVLNNPDETGDDYYMTVEQLKGDE